MMSASYMRQCARKKRYESRDEARLAAGVLAGAVGGSKTVNFYRCDQCLGWHVGKSGHPAPGRSRTGKRPNKRMRGRV